MKHHLLVAAAIIALSGCSSDVQTTSGANYLAQYHNVPVTPSQEIITSAGRQRVKSIDQMVREAASVEPVLKFPARIGLARVDNGSLSNIPPAEAAAWQQTRDRLGAKFGEFVPLNLLVTEMVTNSPTITASYNLQINNIVDKIRLGAARQHLDAVLIYEVHSSESSGSNVLSAANISIIGGYILPSHYHDAQGYAEGLLIDVVQGYPYGTISATAGKESRVSSSWGWGSDYGNQVEFSNRVKSDAAIQLSQQAYDMFTKLATALAEKESLPKQMDTRRHDRKYQ
ncbi:MAG TPA: hypothetical protein VHX39_20470 [Acetobacteraceae bacterium]|nr:hypothetical protein [Acetobacteraceae bacterium]